MTTKDLLLIELGCSLHPMMNKDTLPAKSYRIAVPSLGPEPSDALDPRFGRCQWMLLHTPHEDVWEAVERDPDAMDSGAGRAAANLLAARGVSVVLAGKVGPKAATALKEASIEFHEDLQGPCREVVAAWLSRADA